MEEDKEPADQQNGESAATLSYMNQVAAEGKPHHVRMMRFRAMVRSIQRQYRIQEEIQDWEAIRVASSEPEAPKK